MDCHENHCGFSRNDRFGYFYAFHKLPQLKLSQNLTMTIPLFCHCERAKRTKQSIESIRILKTAESLKDSNILFLDCHDLTSVKSRNDDNLAIPQNLATLKETLCKEIPNRLYKNPL